MKLHRLCSFVLAAALTFTLVPAALAEETAPAGSAVIGAVTETIPPESAPAPADSVPADSASTPESTPADSGSSAPADSAPADSASTPESAPADSSSSLPADSGSSDSAKEPDVSVDVSLPSDPGAEEPGEVSLTDTTDEAKDADQVTEFVTRLYKVVLQRDPDPVGLAQQVNLLKSGGTTGAYLASRFFLEKEYIARNRTDAEFMEDIYNAFFGRPSDAEGLANWLGYLGDGCSREFILEHACTSVEFTDICRSYGITRGSYTSTQNRDKNPAVTAFVNRVYTVVLGRQGEESGLNNWTGLLLARQITGAYLVNNAYFCEEYEKKNTTDEEFVTSLYWFLVDRAPDAEGFNNWMNLLKEGHSRKFVVARCVSSDEFTKLCAQYGIERGSLEEEDDLLPGDGALTPPIYGIDVSQFQSTPKGTTVDYPIDWNAVKASGVKFVMIRAASTTNAGLYEDSYFRRNVRGAKAAGLQVGVYYAAYATNADEVASEVTLVTNAMAALEAEGLRFDYPLVVDMEFHSSLGKATLTNLALNALALVEQKGYYPMLYTYSNYALNCLDLNAFTGYDLWIANYTGSITYPSASRCQMWQYSSSGVIPGISFKTDQNTSYVDYGTKIRTETNGRGQRWNHWGTA